METIEELQQFITEMTADGVRNQLLERGAAWSLIRDQGVLPADAPAHFTGALGRALEMHHAALNRFVEILFFHADDFRHLRRALFQFRKSAPHLLDQYGHQLVDERLALVENLIAEADGPAQDAAQHRVQQVVEAASATFGLWGMVGKYLGEFEYRWNMRQVPHLMLDRLMFSFVR